MTANKQYNALRLLRRFIFAWCYKSFFLPSAMRIRLLRLCGVHIGKKCFIGQFVLFDDLYPQNIFIGDGTTITAGTKIITHFKNSVTGGFDVCEVRIGAHCFVGMNTLFTKPVCVGDNTIIGGGGRDHRFAAECCLRGSSLSGHKTADARELSAR
ncbi:MAG: acyltransferase [Bacteroides sp.]|nr:acyltransferase [Prevotella sp.]MCM1408282.1 hypothetical protein [Treponema brennaborense]MCM1470486.1 acyltransferase [Bacteroides sp.]